jgi:uncharacterized protein
VGPEQIAIVVAGALAGGIVNGLSGFGTALTAVGIWLWAISPATATTLVLISSVVSQLQTLPMIWHSIQWRRVLPFIAPGVVGVPLGTYLLPHVEPQAFKIGIGIFLVVYSSYALAWRTQFNTAWGGGVADGAIGFVAGVLGGLTGFSGVLPAVWTDIRGWFKEQRRSVLQSFNLTILSLALVSHAVAGLMTRPVLLLAALTLPGTMAGAFIGATVYRRLSDHNYQRAVMALLFVSGVSLLWSAL